VKVLRERIQQPIVNQVTEISDKALSISHLPNKPAALASIA
jgi:hypothetical protein